MIGAVFFPIGFRLDQRFQGLDGPLDLGRLLYQIPLDVAASLHQVEVIELLRPLQLLADGFDHRAARVVDEHQDVGHLQGRVLADPQPGGDALHNGALCGPDQGGGALGIIVILQVQGHDQPLAGFAIHRTAHIGKAFPLIFQYAGVHIFLHVGVDGRDPLRLVRPV